MAFDPSTIQPVKGGFDPSTIQPLPEPENALMQGVQGFAARGNQAMAALNPWANDEKIAAEQEWVKQRPAAQIGSGAADIAMTLPAGGAPTAAGRALLSGAIGAVTKEGGIADKVKNFGYDTLGAGIGEGAAKLVGAALHPFKPVADSVRQALILKAEKMGIPLDAADVTGNRSLEYARSALEALPSSSAMQQAQKEAKQRAWEKAILQKGGEYADRPTEAVMEGMKKRISDSYLDIHGRNDLIIDPLFKNELQSIESKQLSRIPTNQKNIVESYLADFNTAPSGANISGKEYQDIRSMLDKQSKAFKNSDPATYQALRDIRSAADSAMARSVSAEDAQALKTANKDWMVMKNIEGSLNAQGAADRNMNPALFANALRRKEGDAMVYGTGNQDMADFAKVGSQFVKDPTKDAGTAQRAMMIAALKGAPLVAAGEEYGRTGGDLTAAAAPLVLSYGLPKIASKLISNPKGYLAEGLVDMTKGNRQKMLADVLRSASIASNITSNMNKE